MSNVKEYIRQLKATNAPFEKQELALTALEKAIQDARENLAKKEEKVTKNIDFILTAFNKIETKLNNKYEELLRTPAMVGEKGEPGKAGRDGKDGKDGKPGRDGRDGKDGRDGIDGKDGVGVVDAKIDFDGSLVIYLSDGNEIDAGQVVSTAVAKEVNAFMTRGEILPLQDGNAGKYLTTDGNTLSWATVSGGSGSGDVVGPSSATANNIVLFDGTTGKLIKDGGKGLPSGNIVGTTDNQTLTTKTISVDDNTISGVAASSFVVSNASGHIDGSAAQKVIPSGVVVGDTDSQTLTNKTLTDPAIIGTILEDVFTITDGAAFEVDPGNGSIQLITLGASRTPKATNFAAGESVTLMVDDGTAYTLTWTDATWGTSGVKWVGGSAPTLATTGYTVIEFWKVGTQVYGALVGNA